MNGPPDEEQEELSSSKVESKREEVSFNSKMILIKDDNVHVVLHQRVRRGMKRTRSIKEQETQEGCTTNGDIR